MGECEEVYKVKAKKYRKVWNSRMPEYGEWFEKYNFYEVFPLDGGGYFVFFERLGSMDDVEISENVISGKPFETWGAFGDLDYAKTSNWQEIENTMWLQRMYVLSSLSRAWWKTKDKKFLNAFKAHLNDWYIKNPFPENLKEYAINERRLFEGQGKYDEKYLRSWFDFQPAARSLWLCWSVYFLLDELSDAELGYIIEMLERHVRALLECNRAWPDMPGNHQVFWGVALLYLGCIFQEESFSRECLDVGSELIVKHVKEEVSSEGFTYEGSPSYMLFSFMQFREAAAVMLRNGKESPVDLRLLEKMAEAILSITQPDGSTPLINDGYIGNSLPTLAISAKLFNRDDFLVFENSNIVPDYLATSFPKAGYSSARTSWTADAGCVILDSTNIMTMGKASHGHGGRLGFSWWANGNHFISNSGTGPYNYPLFGSWYRRSQSHSSVMIDGMEDADFLSEWEWESLPECKAFEPVLREGYSVIGAEIDGFMRLADPVGFSRKLILFDNGALAVVDTFTAIGKHDYKFTFRFTGGKAELCEDSNGKFAIVSGVGQKEDTVLVKPLLQSDNINISLSDGQMFGKEGEVVTPSVLADLCGKGNIKTAFALIPESCLDDEFTLEEFISVMKTAVESV